MAYGLITARARCASSSARSITTALVRAVFGSSRRTLRKEGCFLSWSTSGSRTLGHGNVAFVQLELASVDPGAEAEIGCEDSEKASYHTSDYGSNVGSAFPPAAAAAAAATTTYGNRSSFGGHGTIGPSYCVGYWFASCEWTCFAACAGAVTVAPPVALPPITDCTAAGTHSRNFPKVPAGPWLVQLADSGYHCH